MQLGARLVWRGRSPINVGGVEPGADAVDARRQCLAALISLVPRYDELPDVEDRGSGIDYERSWGRKIAGGMGELPDRVALAVEDRHVRHGAGDDRSDWRLGGVIELEGQPHRLVRPVYLLGLVNREIDQ